MNLLDVILIILGWGVVALIVLAIALTRARALVYRPTPREKAPSRTCGNCRLPFHRASWRCGRCGAYLRPRLFFWFGRGILEPLLSVIVVPWITGVGLLLQGGLWTTRTLFPAAAPRFEQITNRLGVWVAPLFERWVPERWRLPSTGIEVEPEEMDAPVDVLAASALTLGVCLLNTSDERISVEVPEPSEETLRELRDTAGGIHEIWGYVSDGHPLTPTFRDQIISARFQGEDVLQYAEGLAIHLEKPLNQVIIRPALAKPEDTAAAPGDWHFVIRRQPDIQGRYPLRWEIHTSDATLEHIEDVVEDLHTWEALPCSLVME